MAEEIEAGFSVERREGEDGRPVLHFRGRLHIDRAAELSTRLRELLGSCPGAVDFDLSEVESADSGTLALLVDGSCSRADSRIVGAQGTVRRILDLYEVRPHAVCLLPPPEVAGILSHIGRATVEVVAVTREALEAIGEWVVKGLGALRRPGFVRWKDVPRLCERSGADGLPIVVLINLLIGLIMAFQAAMQLRRYGADIFVADLVALSVVRELGPLMTAIIVASRSGAAFAAELGTMKVSEEVDALRTLGFDPVGFLVFPRILALALVLPILTLVADAMAILGGLATALMTLDVTLSGYLVETQGALDLKAVSSGLIKSVAFGVMIAVVACQKGLATRGGAEGVGRSTTSAVVTILFALVALDAVFTILFQIWNY